MVKIGILTTIKYAELSKRFDNSKVLEYVETVYNEYIKTHDLKKSDIILVSNGYPWIDHVPVSLFLKNEDNTNDVNNNEPIDKYAGIELCMPTEINHKTQTFLNTHEGRSLNTSHNKYKEISSIDSLNNLSRIVQAKKSNKKSIIKRGFTQANTLMVRNCDLVLVFGSEEIPSGELWNKILCEKEYYAITH
jgi:hypothetical protein